MPKWVVTVLLFIVAQGLAATVYVARLGTQVEYMGVAIEQIRTEFNAATRFRYTSEDATRDKALMTALLEAINRRIDLAEQRINRLENKP